MRTPKYACLDGYGSVITRSSNGVEFLRYKHAAAFAEGRNNTLREDAPPAARWRVFMLMEVDVNTHECDECHERFDDPNNGCKSCERFKV